MTFPQNISGWDLATPSAAWSVDQQHSLEFMQLTYRRQDRDMHVEIVETLSPTAKLPESRLAPDDSNIWREKQTRYEEVCAAKRCIAFRHSTWQREKSQELRHIYYAYSIGRFTTESRFALRAIHGWNRLSGRSDSQRLLKLVFEGAAPDSAELSSAFLMLQSAVES
jgi:hypothetical protein